MKFINSWKSVFKSKVKQYDKFDITIRISSLTIFKLKFDISRKQFELVVLNFKIKT
jgi:hypothetical protein